MHGFIFVTVDGEQYYVRQYMIIKSFKAYMITMQVLIKNLHVSLPELSKYSGEGSRRVRWSCTYVIYFD